MNMEQVMEWKLAGEIEVLVEDLPQRNFVTHESHLSRLGIEIWPLRWEADN
jgi:hypothetical protein